MKLIDVIVAAMFVTMLSSPASAAATCESLASLSLPQIAITMAQTVPPGALILPTPFLAAGPAEGSPSPRQRISRVLPGSRCDQALERLRDQV
jgi:hypothetical protein